MPQILQHRFLFALRPLGSDREEQARTHARNVVGLAFLAEVAEVVADLVCDPESFAEGAEHVADFLMLLRAGVEGAKTQRDFERRRSFAAEDFEHLQRSKRAGLAHPAQFRSLAAAQLA